MFHRYDESATETVFRLSYVSRRVPSLTHDDLDEITSIAKRNNAKINVSGLLISCGDEFLQILEGYEPRVKALYETIAEDPRHTNLTVVATTRSSQRKFAEWSMGCFQIREDELPEGFVFEQVDGETRLRPDAFFRIDDLLAAFYAQHKSVGASDGFGTAA